MVFTAYRLLSTFNLCIKSIPTVNNFVNIKEICVFVVKIKNKHSTFLNVKKNIYIYYIFFKFKIKYIIKKKKNSV